MDTRTPRTWGENVWPTAQQLADWLKVCTDNERLIHAEIAIRDGQTHDRCMVAHHGRIEEMEAALDRVRAMHTQDDSYLAPSEWCQGCGDRVPCGTIRVLGGGAA